MPLTTQTTAVVTSPYEAYGIVTNVVDGGTFDLSLEGASYAMPSSMERVILADLALPDQSSPQSIEARDLASAILLNKRVYLNIDDASPRDAYGRLVCTVYLSGAYGQPVMLPCFNRIMVDSGYASVKTSSNSEFKPDDWWSGTALGQSSSSNSGSSGSENAMNGLEKIKDDILSQSQEQIIKGINGSLKEAEGWLRNQLSLSGLTVGQPIRDGQRRS